MSSIEENKSIVERFLTTYCSCAATGDFEGLMGVMTEGATWEVVGTLPISGTYPKRDMKELLERMTEQIATPVVWRPTSMIGEDDKVAAECVCTLDLHGGREYRQRYHVLFRIQDDKVAEIVEYCDTKHVADVFLA